MEQKNSETAARELMSWEAFDKCVDKLARKISESRKKYKVIYGIPRGGLVLAVALSHKLNLPLTFDLDSEYKRKDVLVADDIVDTGRTLVEVNRKKCDVAALYVKPWRKYNPEYWTLETAAWVVFPWEEE